MTICTHNYYKRFFANERTLMRWTGLAMNVGALGMALYVFGMSTKQQESTRGHVPVWPMFSIALVLLFLSSVIVTYATSIWRRRTKAILDQTVDVALSGDEVAMPLAIGGLVILSLVGTFVTAVVSLVQTKTYIETGVYKEQFHP